MSKTKEQGTECSPEEFLLRGILASELKCWHRLTADEAQNLVAFVQNMPAKPAQQRPQNCGTGYCSCIECLFEQPAQQEPVTVLPDGSAFAVMSYPLPKDHWLYADRQYNDGEYEPVELGKPVLTHELRDAVVSAVRYAIRGATNCGKEADFDPDALVQNAVYALCGPFTSPASKPLTDEDIYKIANDLFYGNGPCDTLAMCRAIEAAHGIHAAEQLKGGA